MRGERGTSWNKDCQEIRAVKPRKKVWVTVSHPHEHWALSTQRPYSPPKHSRSIRVSIINEDQHISPPLMLFFHDPLMLQWHQWTRRSNLNTVQILLLWLKQEQFSVRTLDVTTIIPAVLFSSALCPGNKVKAAAAASTPHRLFCVQCESWSSVHLRRLSGKKKRKKEKKSWRRFYFFNS